MPSQWTVLSGPLSLPIMLAKDPESDEMLPHRGRSGPDRDCDLSYFLRGACRFRPALRTDEMGSTRAEDAQGTPTQSHISPNVLVYES